MSSETASEVPRMRAERTDRGVEVSEVFHDEGGVFLHAGTTGRVPGPDPERRSYGTWDRFEKAAPPHDWWDWYAPYLSAREQ